MWPDALFPVDPYPGSTPDSSFVHVAGHSHPLRPSRSGWAVAGAPLDTWLDRHGASPSRDRVPLLTYGSNRCPSKITWLRAVHGLGDEPVVVLRARTTGLAAVWASGLRLRDAQRPAVLAAAPGLVEQHAVWLATPAQIAALDRCEGRGDRYRLARLDTGEVRTEDGALIERPWCYLGRSEIRRPLLVDGQPVRCADVAQDAAAALVGAPAGGDGLVARTERGAPDPANWPAALFAYGSLQPGHPAWTLVAPHAAGAPVAASVPGTVLDTGLGYPAWLPDGPGVTPGAVVPLRDPAGLLPVLDEYEGPDYERVRVAVDGRVCWAYAWRSPVDGFRVLPDGWR
ncbi:gamma-glutamylcyclotransferase family protein [Pseudonocardia sp. CA-107938]|uniref:gamma-glutamylcyclotransferase family protein n=1 Tax=Pseudonocardia sp. CA-107938 TaxID=3240021 RepID=UPI003D8C3E52